VLLITIIVEVLTSQGVRMFAFAVVCWLVGMMMRDNTVATGSHIHHEDMVDADKSMIGSSMVMCDVAICCM